jgi:two-component system sensor histidine kinase PilS (NtrC family)
MLRITQRESERLDRILKDFLAFARPAPQRRVRFDLHRHLAEHLELLRRSDEVRSSHCVELSLGENEGLVEGDPDQLAQIVWNLSRNALRAMPSGGTLTLGASIETTHYAIRVADNGKGMTAEERRKLFQPFHSFFDRGTGIGMAIVYRLVTEQGGALGVETSLGRGTTITVTFPNFVSNDPSASDLQETPP